MKLTSNRNSASQKGRDTLNVFAIVLVLGGVARFLAFEIHCVLLHVSIEDVISAEELVALSEAYKRVAGYDKQSLSVNSQPLREDLK